MTKECNCNQTKRVKVQAGKNRWKFAAIDKCLAPLVRDLQQAGVKMRECCCGHGEKPGEIVLNTGAKMHIAICSLER